MQGKPIQRKIIHIDMDAFYAAVEQRDFPEYQGKPVVVGGEPHKRGVVATCSYEARRYGIHSALPTARAYQLCPHAIFVKPRFDVYRNVSRHIQALFNDYTPLIEPLSLDEAYLDVTEVAAQHGSATALAQQLRQRIFDETQLTASAGVSYNKFLAKQASDINKPDAITVIRPAQGPDFMASLVIGKFHGVGKATESKMKQLGIHTGADLLNLNLAQLQQHFGKMAHFYYHIVRGIDERPVVSQRQRKSLSAEITFETDLSDSNKIQYQLQRIAQRLAGGLLKNSLQGKTLTLKVKYYNFKQVTRNQTVTTPLQNAADIEALAIKLLAKTEAGFHKVRLLGIGVSNFTTPLPENTPIQLTLF